MARGARVAPLPGMPDTTGGSATDAVSRRYSGGAGGGSGSGMSLELTPSKTNVVEVMASPTPVRGHTRRPVRPLLRGPAAPPPRTVRSPSLPRAARPAVRGHHTEHNSLAGEGVT